MAVAVRRLVALVLLLIAGTAAAADAPYKIRPDDSVSVFVLGQPDLSKKYSVDAQGRIAVPLVGNVNAGELTSDELAAELKRRLVSDGVLRDPQVTVTVERTKHVFVFGGVSTPGTYQLTEHMTLLEVLARSGYNGASEAVIVRTQNATGPVLPGENPNAQVIRVNLREFEKDVENGRLTRNVALMDGDTVYVPRFDPNRVFVSGQVRSPGAYSVPDQTTVLQLLTLAGGPTEGASLGRIRILRLEQGKQKTITKVKMEDVVRPGDTIIVPERFF